jgi:hypothetical protein
MAGATVPPIQQLVGDDPRAAEANYEKASRLAELAARSGRSDLLKPMLMRATALRQRSGISEADFPASCTLTPDEVLSGSFLPE